MIYTLPYQTEDLFRNSYFEIRNTINSQDIIHLTVTHSHLQDLSRGEIYKKVLKLDGIYRTETNNWTRPPIKVRIINQL